MQTIKQLSFRLLLSHTSAKHYKTRTKHAIPFLSDTRLGFNCVKCLFHIDPIILKTISIVNNNHLLHHLFEAYNWQSYDLADNFHWKREKPHYYIKSNFTTKTQLCRLSTSAQNTAQIQLISNYQLIVINTAVHDLLVSRTVSIAQHSVQTQTLQPYTNESGRRNADPSLLTFHFLTSYQQNLRGDSSYNVLFRHVIDQKVLCTAYQIFYPIGNADRDDTIPNHATDLKQKYVLTQIMTT